MVCPAQRDYCLAFKNTYLGSTVPYGMSRNTNLWVNYGTNARGSRLLGNWPVIWENSGSLPCPTGVPTMVVNPSEWPDFGELLHRIYGHKLAPDSQSIIHEGRGDR